jgi:hypothetical protein
MVVTLERKVPGIYIISGVKNKVRYFPYKYIKDYLDDCNESGIIPVPHDPIEIKEVEYINNKTRDPIYLTKEEFLNLDKSKRRKFELTQLIDFIIN